MLKKHFPLITCLTLCSLAPLQAAYIGPPSGSAGVVEREIQEEYFDSEEILPNRETPLIDIDLPEKELSYDETTPISVSNIYIKGNTVFSSCLLQQFTTAYEGKTVFIKDLQELCKKIQCYYLNRGYFLTRVFLPSQKIVDQTVTIQVVEGSIGKVEVQGNCHYKTSFICKYFRAFKGKPICYNDFMRTMLLINEYDDLQVGAVFKKGEEFGTADLTLRIVDHRPIHLYANTNNYGSSSTSKQRSGGRLDWGNLLVSGDKFSIAQVFGSPIDQLTFTEGRYRLPLNTNGSFIEAAYLYSDFDVGVDRSLKLGGRSNIASGKFTHALARRRRVQADLSLGFDYKQIKNHAQGKTNSFDKLRNATVGLSFDWLDRLWGRNILSASGALGIPNFLGGLSAVDPVASRLGAGGKYLIGYLDYTRVQSLFCDAFLILQGHGQFTTYKLPLTEQIYIGGSDTVRGYNIATSLGDKGYHATIELRSAIPFIKNCKVPFSCKQWRDLVQLVFFYDRGQTWLNGDKTTSQKKMVALNGAGAGFRVYGPWKFQWSFDIGFPLSSERKSSDSVYYFKVSWQLF